MLETAILEHAKALTLLAEAIKGMNGVNLTPQINVTPVVAVEPKPKKEKVE